MRALINGAEGGNLSLQRGESASWKVMLIDYDGSILNLTGDTVTLSFYDRSDRLNAATVTVTLTLTTPTSGFCTAAITVTNTNALTAGQLYYVVVKRDVAGAGTTVTIGDKAATCQVA